MREPAGAATALPEGAGVGGVAAAADGPGDPDATGATWAAAVAGESREQPVPIATATREVGSHGERRAGWVFIARDIGRAAGALRGK